MFFPLSVTDTIEKLLVEQSRSRVSSFEGTSSKRGIFADGQVDFKDAQSSFLGVVELSDLGSVLEEILGLRQ